jgi:hypothetical protein
VNIIPGEKGQRLAGASQAADIQGMTNEAIVAEYIQVLTAIDTCRAGPEAPSLASPSRPYKEAVRIGMGGRAAKQRLEETRLLTRLMQLEEMYGSDPEDLRRIAAAGRASPRER